jgi:hypothetical protein
MNRKDNEEFTGVGLGAPMDEVLRRVMINSS